MAHGRILSGMSQTFSHPDQQEQVGKQEVNNMAKTKLNTPRGGGPTIQRRSARLAERQASSASVPFAPGRSPSMSRLSIATLAQPLVSPILSPSPVLPESPSPQSSQCQNQSRLKPPLPRPPFLLPMPPSPKPLFSQYSVPSKFPLLLFFLF